MVVVHPGPREGGGPRAHQNHLTPTHFPGFELAVGPFLELLGLPTHRQLSSAHLKSLKMPLQGQGGGLDLLYPTPSQPVGMVVCHPGPGEGGGPRAHQNHSTPSHFPSLELLVGPFLELLLDPQVWGDFDLLRQRFP